jgi:enoyl-CoA hydratase
MPWTIEHRDGVAIVTMNTNKANAQNPSFFRDKHAALDRLEHELPQAALVLTGQGSVFSAGLDFDYHFPLFATLSRTTVREWFDEYRATNLRLFTFPRPTVAAINGHAYAGGLITALACDYRVAVDTAQFSLNEVPIGIPMPSVYIEMMRHAIGPMATSLLTLSGIVIDSAEAHRLGLVHECCSTDLVTKAMEWAQKTPMDCREAYAYSKVALLAPVLENIERISRRMDAEELPKKMTHVSGLSAQRRRYEELKKRPAHW